MTPRRRVHRPEPHLSTTFRRAALAAALGLVLATIMAGPETAAADDPPPGSIRFVAKNLVATANGRFTMWRIGRATIDEADPAKSSVEVVVDLSSIDTENRKRDDHLRSADFFDVARYPSATAALRGFRADGPDRFVADVTLDLHGHEKSFPMTFEVVDRSRRRVRGETKLNRMDWKIGEPHSALNPLSIDEEVVLTVEATVPAATAAAD